MNKILFFIAIVMFFSPLSFADWEAQVTPEELVNYITWEEAVGVLENCEIDHYIQYHSLQISLVMKDGSVYNSIQPDIDNAEVHAQKGWVKCGVTEVITITE